MNAQATTQQWQHTLHLRQFTVFIAQSHDGVVEDFIDESLLIVIRDIHLLQGHCIGLTLLPAETENNQRQIASVTTHSHNLLQVAQVGFALSFQHLLGVHVGRFCCTLQGCQSFVEIVFPKLTFFIYHHVHSIPTSWKQVVLQWHRALVCIDHMTRLMFDSADPFCKFPGIGDGRRQENQANGVWEKNHDLLPHHSTIAISHVVHLIKHHPCHFSGNI
mmetsp:Transcript_11737/g.25816  ORF Transcript_11737/g.25816 Transcript_11737/m.25816 type:complete len:218 (+) Transcript_11737:1811-2464(+)